MMRTAVFSPVRAAYLALTRSPMSRSPKAARLPLRLILVAALTASVNGPALVARVRVLAPRAVMTPRARSRAPGLTRTTSAVDGGPMLE